jgi:hypothetical protein
LSLAANRQRNEKVADNIEELSHLLLTSGALSAFHSLKSISPYSSYRNQAEAIITKHFGRLPDVKGDPKFKAAYEIVSANKLESCLVLCDKEVVRAVERALSSLGLARTSVQDADMPLSGTYDIAVILTPSLLANYHALKSGAKEIYGLVASGTADEEHAELYVKKKTGEDAFKQFPLL